MPHVDEGLLHAYLDGAFASEDAQCVEIEAHLASCTDCGVRLEVARALNDRAREVLRQATPIDVRVPPFEALRARKQEVGHAGAPAQRAAQESGIARRLARSQVRLAWAASVVLAVGAGWMANELIRRDTGELTAVRDAATVAHPEPMSGSDADASSARASSTEEATEADPREGSARADARVDSAAESSDERQAAAPSAEEPRIESEPQVAASREPEALPGFAERLRRRAAASREPEAPPGVAERLRAQVQTARTSTLPAVTPADATSARVTRTTYRASDVIALDMMPPALADGRAFYGHVALLNDYTAAVDRDLWTHATAEQAAAALGRQPAGIGNLRPTETETAVVDGRVLVSQLYTLDGGAQLELIQRPATPAFPYGAARVSGALPHAGVALKNLGESGETFRGESVVAASRPGLVLLLKGPVSRDSLHAITARIE